jgi:ubiquinone/menaquinone biosynthesis C-methylase UbiE
MAIVGKIMSKNYWVDGDIYKDLNTKAQFLNGLELVRKIQLKDGDHVLDVGCGTGNVLLHLAQHHPNCNFVGIDLSSSMLDVGKKQADLLNIHNIKFIQANIEELDIDLYDAIISNAAFHWFNKERVLEKLASSLRNDGTLAIYTAGIDNVIETALDKEEREFLLSINQLGLVDYYKKFDSFSKRRITPLELMRSFVEKDLVVSDYGMVLRKVYFSNFEEYFSWLKASGSMWLDPLDKNQQEAVCSYLIEKLKLDNSNEQYSTYHASAFCVAQRKGGAICGLKPGKFSA